MLRRCCSGGAFWIVCEAGLNVQGQYLLVHSSACQAVVGGWRGTLACKMRGRSGFPQTKGLIRVLMANAVSFEEHGSSRKMVG